MDTPIVTVKRVRPLSAAEIKVDAMQRKCKKLQEFEFQVKSLPHKFPQVVAYIPTTRLKPHNKIEEPK